MQVTVIMIGEEVILELLSRWTFMIAFFWKDPKLFTLPCKRNNFSQKMKQKIFSFYVWRFSLFLLLSTNMIIAFDKIVSRVSFPSFFPFFLFLIHVLIIGWCRLNIFRGNLGFSAENVPLTCQPQKMRAKYKKKQVKRKHVQVILINFLIIFHVEAAKSAKLFWDFDIYCSLTSSHRRRKQNRFTFNGNLFSSNFKH